MCREEERGECRKRGGVTGYVGKCGTIEMNCEWRIKRMAKGTRNVQNNQSFNQSCKQTVYFYLFTNSKSTRVNFQRNRFWSKPLEESIGVNSFLSPVLQIHKVSVHSISTFARAAYAPAHCTHQIPLVAVLGADQRPSTISLACVNLSRSVSCTAHAFWDGVP